MGTSNAYDGTPGWKGIRNDTDAWVKSRTEPRRSDTGGRDSGQMEETRAGAAGKSRLIRSDNPLLIRLLGGVVRKIIEHLFAGEPDVVIIRGGSGAERRARGRRRDRSRRHAAVSGGGAIAAMYGVRSGDADSVSDAGLALGDMTALTPFEQARKIVDAASGTSSSVEEAEIREVNANFVCWAIEQESPPLAPEMVKEWVHEYVYQFWLTEAGSCLRDGSRGGEEARVLEQEARAAIEAIVSDIDLSVDGIRASHIEAAIQTLLRKIGERYR